MRAKHLLEDIVGSPVIGYRAPSFSITDAALDLLRDAGYRYDSSWFPVGGHDRYGRVDLHRRTVEHIATDRRRCVSAAKLSLDNGLVELPITTLSIGRRVLPWGGGGWFRLYPSHLFRLGFRRAVLRAGGGIFYLHPWEIDPDQPRVTGIPRSHAFRHYVNLDPYRAASLNNCVGVSCLVVVIRSGRCAQPSLSRMDRTTLTDPLRCLVVPLNPHFAESCIDVPADLFFGFY